MLPLNRNDRKKLFYQYADYYNLNSVSDNDVNFFVDKLLQSPSQILNAVEACVKQGVVAAKQDIEYLVLLGTKRMKPLLDVFVNEELSKHILVVLSMFEFVSFEFLGKVFDGLFREVQQVVSKMMVYGIVSTFGPSSSFLRLDHFICDYIRRNNIFLPKDLETFVLEVAENSVTSSEITEDVSLYLFNAKQSIIKGRGNSKAFLVPSIVIKSLVDVYNAHNYKLVVDICDRVLCDSRIYYQDFHRELSYWACLALCRMAKDDEKSTNRFRIEIKQIDGADEKFLRGFFYRNLGEYSQAEKCFRAALGISPNMQRAKRELVAVLLCLRNFDEALSLAKENYEKDADNTYHIHAYFRCLVKKRVLQREDITILKNLMEAVQSSYSVKKDELYAAMNIEFCAYVKRADVKGVLSLIKEYQKDYPSSMDVRRAANEYKYKQGIFSARELEKEEYDFDTGE